MVERMTDKDISDQLTHLEGPERHMKDERELRECFKWYHEPNLANRLESPDYATTRLSIRRHEHTIQGPEIEQLGQKIFQEQYGLNPETGKYD